MNAYRIVLIGNSYVGKTALIMRYVNKAIEDHYQETIGAAFHTFQSKINDKQYTFQVWDTAGQEKYRSLGPVYYRNAQAAILVFDLTERQSFLDLPEWIKEFRGTAGNNPLIFIVGNKADLEDQIKVEQDEISKFAEKEGYIFFITSAVSGLNVDFLFQTIAEQIVRASQCNQPRIETDINLNHKKQNKSCC